MALLGRAVMINWSDVPLAHRRDYYAWHDREHMAGRLRVPGFRRGRRHLAVDADRDIFNLYEVDDLRVLTSGSYVALTQRPSEASQRLGRVIVNAVRALAHVEFTSGVGIGAFVHTLRFDAQEGRDEALRSVLRQTVLAGIVDRDGIAAVHLCVADRAASTAVSAERRGRPTFVPDWSIIIEGSSAEDVRAAGDALRADDLVAAGAAGDIVRGTYALQRLVTSDDVI